MGAALKRSSSLAVASPRPVTTMYFQGQFLTRVTSKSPWSRKSSSASVHNALRAAIMRVFREEYKWAAIHAEDGSVGLRILKFNGKIVVWGPRL